MLSQGFTRYRSKAWFCCRPAPLSFDLLVYWMATKMVVTIGWQRGLLRSWAPASHEASSMYFVHLLHASLVSSIPQGHAESQVYIFPQRCNDFILPVFPPMLWPHTPPSLWEAELLLVPMVYLELCLGSPDPSPPGPYQSTYS